MRRCIPLILLLASLSAAAVAPADAAVPLRQGEEATVVGTPGGVVSGTDGPDVIVTNGADASGADGDDLICVDGLEPGGPGDETARTCER